MFAQNVLRELEQKKPQLDELVHTAENLRADTNRQQLHDKGKSMSSILFSYSSALSCPPKCSLNSGLSVPLQGIYVVRFESNVDASVVSTTIDGNSLNFAIRQCWWTIRW